jgi:chromosome segregation ATPase
MFQRILSNSHVKVSKSDWDKIEKMFKEKENEITTLRSKLNSLDSQDELLFETELYCKKLVKENQELKETLKTTTNELNKINGAFKASKSLESAYLQKLSEYKRNSTICEEYSTRTYKSLTS